MSISHVREVDGCTIRQVEHGPLGDGASEFVALSVAQREISR